jgi:hypothetical protein
MKKLPKVNLITLVLCSLAVTAVGFILMLIDKTQELGAVMFMLGVVSLVFTLPKDL